MIAAILLIGAAFQLQASTGSAGDPASGAGSTIDTGRVGARVGGRLETRLDTRITPDKLRNGDTMVRPIEQLRETRRVSGIEPTTEPR